MISNGRTGDGFHSGILSEPPLEIVLLALTFYQKRHGYGFSTQFFNFILQSTILFKFSFLLILCIL